MALVDTLIIAAYLLGIIVFSLWRRPAPSDSAVEYMLDGRRLTLPAFVATLVCNWYGGILGVGEYSYRYGISNWFVFGLPYYLGALLFAWLLAAKARRTEFITIPDRLNQYYGRPAAILGAVVVFGWTLPTAYILILGVLGQAFFGWPKSIGIVIGAVIVTIYAFIGGFRTLVRADIWHFLFMYLGFAVIFIALVAGYGGQDFLTSRLPETHFQWHGGNSAWFIIVWYFIALSTLVEPSFFQACYAARDEKTARRGILVSILCWFVFDMLTTTCGLYARAILPSDIDPVSAFPLLGQEVLPAGLFGIFAVSLIATVISTADSYLFIAASTAGKDIFARWRDMTDEIINRYTKWALIGSAVLTVVISAFFESVVTVWYGFGSVGTPILLVPLLTTFVGNRVMSGRAAVVAMVLGGLASTVWLGSAQLTSDGAYALGIEPIFPGLAASLLVYLVSGRRRPSYLR